jgi:hypothetical protein
MHRMSLVYRQNNLRAGDLKGESLYFDMLANSDRRLADLDARR